DVGDADTGGAAPSPSYIYIKHRPDIDMDRYDPRQAMDAGGTEEEPLFDFGLGVVLVFGGWIVAGAGAGAAATVGVGAAVATQGDFDLAAGYRSCDYLTPPPPN